MTTKKYCEGEGVLSFKIPVGIHIEPKAGNLASMGTHICMIDWSSREYAY